MNRLVPLLLACLFSVPAVAAEDATEERIRAFLETRLKGATIGAIMPSPLPGIYQAVVASQVVYISADARYLLQGRLLDMEEGRDLTEPVVRDERLVILNKVPESLMVIYEPDGEPRHTITTFTDIDCPYCRRMHAEMAELNASGIRVRYMLYPRAGIGSKSHAKALSVWCAEDRNEALTRSKNGEELPVADCANPIAEHMEIAQQLGLTGTPYTITDTGEKISGYAPAATLVQRLDASKDELAKAN